MDQEARQQLAPAFGTSQEASEPREDVLDLLPEDVRERLRALGVDPAEVNRYGGDRVRWVLDALGGARQRRPIANPAGWVLNMLAQNWELPAAVVQHVLPFAATAAESNRPPEGTTWAREKATGIVLEVLDVNEVRVQFVGGVAAPAHRWQDWEWLSAPPSGDDCRQSVGILSGETPHEPAGDELPTSSDVGELSPDKRAALARVAAWSRIRHRAPSEVAAKLQACGLTLDEWEGYQAVPALDEALSAHERKEGS